MKRILALIFCMMLVVSLFSVSVSASEEVQPRSTYIDSSSAECTVSNGVVTVSSSLRCDADKVDSVSVVLYMQRRSAGSSGSWTVIGVYNGSGTYACSASGEKDYNSAYEYRAYALFSIDGSDGGSETAYKYSGIV